MKIKTLPKIGMILFFIIAFASCEEDFNTIGVDIIGDDVNQVADFIYPVVAYSRKINPIETNNLPVYQLGIYNDPVYGKSTVNAVTQLELSSGDPTFGDGLDEFPPTVESVYLYIPFFSNPSGEGEDTTYTLDSIFGNDPINISIYESNYFLNDFDPDTNFDDPQKYYSDLGSVFNVGDNKGELLVEIENYIPSNEGYFLPIPDSEDINLVAPGLRVELPIDFFKEKIVDKEGSTELLNNNNFNEYFRGLYFEVESVNGSDNGNLFLFDISRADVKIKYTFDREVTDTEDEDEDGDTTDQIIKNQTGEYALNFTGVNVNLFNNEESIDEFIPDTVNGEETLYLRGGDGYSTVINLFEDIDLYHYNDLGEIVNEPNGIRDGLDDLRSEDRLLNEANLIFYVDQNMVSGGSTEPDRVLIYNLDSNLVLVDYGFDLTQGESPENAITQHLGKLERGNDENGDYYKIRITNHMNNLVNRDSTNVPLGLVVSQNVIQGGFQDLETSQDPVTTIPASSVISPEGTVLHGNLSSNADKKLQLRVYYTDPN